MIKTAFGLVQAVAACAVAYQANRLCKQLKPAIDVAVKRSEMWITENGHKIQAHDDNIKFLDNLFS